MSPSMRSLRVVLVTALMLLGAVLGFAVASRAAPAASAAIGWTTVASMPTARRELAVVTASNGKIYAIGGQNAAGYLATVEEFDPVTNTWRTRLDMPTPRAGLGASATGNGKIFAIGGYNLTGTLDTVEEYDISTNTWTTKEHMPTARGSYVGVATAGNGKIYAIGGFLNNAYKATIEEYDPAGNAWNGQPDMRVSRSDLGVAAADGKVFAIGGYYWGGYTGAVEAFDPSTNTWSTRTDMPTARNTLGVATAPNGKIYAIGGYHNAIGLLNTVEEYDPVANTWRARSGMPTARNRLGVAAAPDGKIYAIGGYHSTLGDLAIVERFDPTEIFYRTFFPAAYEQATSFRTPVPTATPTSPPLPTNTPTATSTATAVPVPSSCPNEKFLAQYFANPDVTGTPVITRCEDAPLHQDWGQGSPGPGVPTDRFSGRWTGRFNFPAGDTYYFNVYSDDGVRVWVDGVSIIDDWVGQAGWRAGSTYVAGGLHEVRIEFFDDQWAAHVEMTWSRTAPTATATATAIPSSCPTGQYLAQYFNNPDLAGTPQLTRCEDAPLERDWELGSPGGGIPTDSFSARWTGAISFAASGTYTFTANADDGVRLWIDSAQVIDDWRDVSGIRTGSTYVASGFHQVRVEFKEAGGGAYIYLSWTQ
ncbi:MAG: hypothetical protein HY675_09120 [Chloroflexi bacterium]|nr:hypothetical protein [Chloroflexota bacterium]